MAAIRWADPGWCRADDKGLRDRYLAEYPKVAAKLAARYEQVRGRGTLKDEVHSTEKAGVDRFLVCFWLSGPVGKYEKINGND